MDISVIIVSYNVREFLHQSLLSIEKAAAGLKVEIFVVDNASIDGTPEFVREHFPAVHLIANTENAGFGAANNQALREAEGNYILFLNPDTIIQEDTLSVMMDYMDRHPECGLSGCKILNADGSLQLACRRSFPTPMVTLPKMLGLSALLTVLCSLPAAEVSRLPWSHFRKCWACLPYFQKVPVWPAII